MKKERVGGGKTLQFFILPNLVFHCGAWHRAEWGRERLISIFSLGCDELSEDSNFKSKQLVLALSLRVQPIKEGTSFL